MSVINDAERLELRKHTDLTAALIGGIISAGRFEDEFVSLWGADEVIWSDQIFAALDRLFGVVDAFVEDGPTTRPDPHSSAV